MSAGFVIEFSVNVADDGNEQQIERFRVLVKNGRVSAFEAFAGPFGDTIWLEATDDARSGACEDARCIIAWAFDGYVSRVTSDMAVERAPTPSGARVIDLGFVEREAEGTAAPSPPARDVLQAAIFAWTQQAFTIDQAISLPQRGLRLLEEAIEAFQAVGGDVAMARKLVDYVFSRPVGVLHQELGGVGVCILALAAAAGLSADKEERREVARVLALPIEEFRKRNAAKSAAGFLMLEQRPTHCTRCHEAFIDGVCACPSTDPVANPLLTPDQRAQMRARLADTPGLTLLDLAKDELRVAGVSYPDLAQLDAWIEADVRHRQAAILYVYECVGALGVDYEDAQIIKTFLVELHHRAARATSRQEL